MKFNSFACIAIRSAFALAAAITNASAADITWGTPTAVDVNDASQVSTTGASVLAVQPSNQGDNTVNGVAFLNNQTQNGVTLSTAGLYGANGFTGGSLNTYERLLDGGWYGNGTPYLTLSGLTVGQKYQLQFWVADFRAPNDPVRSETLTGGSNTSGDLTFLNAAAGAATYILGTFTADGDQVITMTGTALPGQDAQVNAFQLRNISATWSGTTDGTWADSDTTSSNFSGLSFSAAKALSPVAVFGDTAAGGGPVSNFNVTVGTGGASIGTVALENTGANSYVFSSADSTGITGATAVSKTGNGTVTFSGANTYSGGTTIGAGTLVAGNTNALGATGSALALTGSAAILDMGAFTGTVGSLSIANGSITGSGGTLNAGAITVGNGVNPSATVGISGITLAGSSFKVQGNSGNGSGAGLSTPVTISSGTLTTSGDLGVGRWAMTIAGDSTVNVGGVIGGGGIVSSPDWGTLTIQDTAVVTATGGVNGNAEAWQLNLNGGTLHTPSIQASDRESGGSARLVFNGTTVVATGHNGAFVTVGANDSSTNSALVGNNGAIFDSAAFNIGIGVNLKADGSSTGGLTKQGSGTLTLSGANTYIGDTTVDAGTLVLADDSQLKFVVDDSPASNMVTGSGTATFNGEFTIDTDGVSGNTGYIWTLVDRATLTGDSFGSTFSVIGYSDPEDDGIWSMSDAKGDWTFDESTGELTLDVGSDYDSWKTANGVTGGPNNDDDKDGLTNHEEYAFGLDPTGGSSVNPITSLLNKGNKKFSYTRRDTTLPDPALNYTVWFSTDLTTWTEDTGATEGTPVLNGEVETVEVTLSTLPGDPLPDKLFIQVRAD